MLETKFNCEETRKDTKQSGNFRVSLCLFAIAVLFTSLLISCQSAPEKETNLFAQDARAKSELSRVSQVLSGGYPLTTADFESIKQIRAKYPNSVEVRNVYKSALIKRGDWETLAKLIEEISAQERTREDNLNLAKSYVKVGRYQNEINLLKPLADANPQDLDYNSLLAYGYFYLGQTDDAAKYFDAVWNEIVQNKKLDEINMRGMIYFRRKEYDKAIETFRKSLEINPEDVSANNGLSRVYAAQGNAEQAEVYRLKTEQAQNAINANEAKASRMVQNSYQLEDAWRAKRYEEVINLVRQMLSDASEQNKPALYQYLAESYKALGKPEEAQKALAEAQNSKQK